MRIRKQNSSMAGTVDEIWLPDAEQHADYYDMVEVATGRKFQYDGRLFFKTENTYNSDVDRAITTKFGVW